MIKNLQITLYEVFGYFLPGVVALFAVLLGVWVVFLPSVVLVVQSSPVELWALASFSCYFLGHAMHAFAGVLGQPENTSYRPPEKVTSFGSTIRWIIGSSANKPVWFHKEVIDYARQRAASVIGVGSEHMTDELLFSFCDEMLSQKGEIGDREIYQYRGGFYKSMSMSLLVLAPVLVICSLRPELTLQYDKTCLRPTSIQYVCAMAAISAVFISYIRKFCWFAQHRARRAVLGFLVVNETTKQSTTNEPAKR
jgi:hypothetical protein